MLKSLTIISAALIINLTNSIAQDDHYVPIIHLHGARVREVNDTYTYLTYASPIPDGSFIGVHNNHNVVLWRASNYWLIRDTYTGETYYMTYNSNPNFGWFSLKPQYNPPPQ